MTQEMTRKRATFFGGRRSTVSNPPWHVVALAAVLLLSAFLNLYRITALGYANTYYAAAVKDMLRSWHNFFFVSFDAGFVSVDKPPLGLWIQAASAWIFGFHGWSLLLPQALAGVASVALLYHLVGRTFGRGAGLLSAFALALTPIVVATSRDNTADMLLVFTVLVAAWAVIRSVETGRLRWLLLCAVIVGLGFNIKMMQAFLVLPAFYLLYLLCARVRWWKRFVHLALATVVLLAVSFSWATVVDLTPAKERPYVGSSQGNSVYNLILGYNGFQRLLGNSDPLSGLLGGSAQTQQNPAAQQGNTQGGPQASAGPGGGGNMVPNEYGAQSPLRLFNQQMAGQISWLLPLALIGAIAVAWRRRPSFPLGRRYRGFVLWGTWTLAVAAYFSVASEGHRYYLVMLAPGLAALVGAGTSALWRDYRSPGWRGWGLPLALLITAGAQAYILRDYEGWNLYLTSAVAVLCLAAAALLVAVRLRPTSRLGRYAAVGLTAGLFSLFIAPAAWASYTVASGSNGAMPAAGPQSADAMGGMPGGSPGANPNGAPGGARSTQAPGGQAPQIASGSAGPERLPSGAMGPGGMPGGPGDKADTALIKYLEKNQGDAKYLAAGTSAMSTGPIILNTDEPVIDLGGFQGRDPVFTVEEISNLVKGGKLKYFLLQDQSAAPAQPSAGHQTSTEGSTGGSQVSGAPEGSSNGSVTAPPSSSGRQSTPPQPPLGARQGAPPQPPQGPPPEMLQGMQQGAPGQEPPGPPPNGQQSDSTAPKPQNPSSQSSGSQASGPQNLPSQGSRRSGFPIPPGMPGGGPGGQQTAITRWVQNNCEKVPASKYEASGSEGFQAGGGPGGGSLYACGSSSGSGGASSTAPSGDSPNSTDTTFADAVALVSRRFSASAPAEVSAGYAREARL